MGSRRLLCIGVAIKIHKAEFHIFLLGSYALVHRTPRKLHGISFACFMVITKKKKLEERIFLVCLTCQRPYFNGNYTFFFSIFFFCSFPKFSTNENLNIFSICNYGIECHVFALALTVPGNVRNGEKNPLGRNYFFDTKKKVYRIKPDMKQ